MSELFEVGSEAGLIVQVHYRGGSKNWLTSRTIEAAQACGKVIRLGVSITLEG